jgi:hypothetical protein
MTKHGCSRTAMVGKGSLPRDLNWTRPTSDLMRAPPHRDPRTRATRKLATGGARQQKFFGLVRELRSALLTRSRA